MWKVVYYLTPSSFCFGVERAVNQLSSIIISHPWDKVFCIHALVHNPKVTKSFEDAWVIFVESIDDVYTHEAVVVFSAHGINRTILAQAKSQFKSVYNLECPFVTKIYNEIDDFIKKWVKTFFYIGKEHHQEGKNILEYIASQSWSSYVLCDKMHIPQLDKHTPFAVLSQTTLHFMYVQNIIEIIKLQYPHALLPDLSDVCKATYERQAVVHQYLDMFDVFIVIWGKESNNSKELADIWLWHKKKTFYWESLDDILSYPSEELFACERVAITWWASTPAWDIKAVFDLYREHGYEPKILSLK